MGVTVLWAGSQEELITSSYFYWSLLVPCDQLHPAPATINCLLVLWDKINHSFLEFRIAAILLQQK